MLNINIDPPQGRGSAGEQLVAALVYLAWLALKAVGRGTAFLLGYGSQSWVQKGPLPASIRDSRGNRRRLISDRCISRFADACPSMC